MNLPKQGWLIAAVVGFLIAYLIDKISGPVSIVIGNPVVFLHSSVLLNKYPFTATAILIRTLSIFISAVFLVDLVPRKYFLKATVILFIGMLGEFYAIQQLATGSHLTSIQWTLSIAYGSLSLTLVIVWTVLKGIWSLFNKEKIRQAQAEAEAEKSILKPPEENNNSIN